MRTGVSTASTRAPLVLLVLAIVLALVGVGGLVGGAADDNNSGHSKSAVATSTTTTEVSSDTTSPLVTVPVPSTGVTTTTRKSTATTKASTVTTAGPTGPCAHGSSTSDPGAQKVPANGSYTYARCDNGADADTFKVSAGPDASRRIVTISSPQGTQNETRNYTAGVVREKFVTSGGGATVTCDWNPDIVQYPAQLAVGTKWKVDSSCEDKNLNVKVHVTGSATVTERVSIIIGGTTVNAWSVASDITIAVTGFVNQTVHSVSTTFYEPTRGLEVYDKSTVNGQTLEKVLKTLNPKP